MLAKRMPLWAHAEASLPPVNQPKTPTVQNRVRACAADQTQPGVVVAGNQDSFGSGNQGFGDLTDTKCRSGLLSECIMLLSSRRF